MMGWTDVAILFTNVVTLPTYVDPVGMLSSLKMASPHENMAIIKITIHMMFITAPDLICEDKKVKNVIQVTA